MFENKDYIIFFEDLKLLNIIKHNYSYDLKQKKWFFNFEHISKLIGEKFFESKFKCDLQVNYFMIFFSDYILSDK